MGRTAFLANLRPLIFDFFRRNTIAEPHKNYRCFEGAPFDTPNMNIIFVTTGLESRDAWDIGPMGKHFYMNQAILILYIENVIIIRNFIIYWSIRYNNCFKRDKN